MENNSLKYIRHHFSYHICSAQFSTIQLNIFDFQLLTEACKQPDGHEKVTKAMDDYKVYCGEKYRFEGLVLSVITKPCNPPYQV